MPIGAPIRPKARKPSFFDAGADLGSRIPGANRIVDALAPYLRIAAQVPESLPPVLRPGGVARMAGSAIAGGIKSVDDWVNSVPYVPQGVTPEGRRMGPPVSFVGPAGGGQGSVDGLSGYEYGGPKWTDPTSPAGRKAGMKTEPLYEGIPEPSDMDVLKERFGFSMGKARPDTDDAAARAGFLTRGATSQFQELPRSGTRYGRTEGGHGEENIVEDRFEPAGTPTRAQSARERGFENLQIQQAEDQQARIQQGIAYDMEMSARMQRQAAEDAFFKRTGLPYDEKSALKIAEFDRKAIEEEKFNTIMADLGAQEQQYLSIARPEEHAEIRAQFKAAREEQLMILSLRSGLSLGGAFNPRKGDDAENPFQPRAGTQPPQT